MSARLDWISQTGGPLHGALRVPGDKSISHRALMLAALARGT
ncbi:3-phosphoshikimate 1-carboxyvinyltransferase, core domain protein, partial [mine drainage metagenome]